MASYEALIFQQENFEEELKKIGDKALEEAAKVVKNGSRWSASEKDQAIEGDWDKQINLMFNDLRAWVDEYGSGLYVEADRNPYWGEYKGSGLTYPSRSSSGAIVRRGRGEYSTLDVTTGEIVSHNGGNPPGGHVSPSIEKGASIAANPFLQDLLNEAYQAFENSFNQQLESLDMSKFITKETIQV